MSDNRHDDRPTGADDQELGAALGKAVAREADSPATPPPVADITERAAARARARRVRHGVVGIAAAAALIAGLVTWNTLGGDGGDGTIHVATEPTVLEQAESAASGSAPAVDEVDPDAAQPLAPAADEAAAASMQPADPQPVDPAVANPDDGAQEPAASTEPSSSPASDVTTAEELSTGPTLTWSEVTLDTSTGLIDGYRIESVGDGRIVAHAWGDAGDQVVVTTDGTTWTAIGMPDGISPDLAGIGGDRWVVGGPDTTDPQHRGRVFFSDDEGTSWTELTIDVVSDAEPLPSHCVGRSRLASVLASGDRMVAVVETYTDLDLQELLVASGRAPDRDSILYWRYTDSALVVYLGEDTDAESIEVPFDELGLAPGQPAPCAGPDGRHDQRVHILTSNGAGTESVGRYNGVNTSAISTAEGFFLTLRTGEGELLLTSPDGRTWTEQAISEQGYVPVTRGPDGAAWRSVRSYDSYRIERLNAGSGSGTVAEFEGLRPGPILAAGPAGVVTTAEPISRAGTDSPPEIRIVKDGYELRLDQAWGDLALWDLAGDVAVYQFAAPEIMFRASPPEGLRFVAEDDGSQTLVFEDPDTGDDLVAFTSADLESSAAQFTDGLGALEPPPTWIGWSAGGTAWGWQSVADAFGIDTGGTYPRVELAVGNDFVLAQVFLVTDGETVSQSVSTDGSESQRSATRSPEARWFIARVE